MSFLDYSGKYSICGDRYIFTMKNGKNKISKFHTSIKNPSYDKAFDNIFCTEKSILKSILNSVLFPESKLIEKLEYSKTYFTGVSEIHLRYGYSTKSNETGCKCFLKKNNELNIKNNILMCNVEMQVGFFDKVEQSFIDYVNKIKVDSSIPETWIVSFILQESLENKKHTIKSSKISSENVVKVKEYKSMKLIEINLNYCSYLLQENKDIEIINGEILDTAGQEWIKLLSIPTWCDNNKINDEIFILPLVTQKNFFSCSFVRKAMDNILRNVEHIDLSDVDEHYDKIERKKYYKLKKHISELEQELKELKKEKEKYDKKGNYFKKNNYLLEDDEEDDDNDSEDIKERKNKNMDMDLEEEED